MNIPLLKHPSAFLPLGMSIIALLMVITHAVIFGIVSEPDEGTLAHLFQLLIIIQAPIILFFAIKWLEKAPKQTVQILLLQTSAALAAIFSVYFLT
jgi:hypothetical protein